MMNEMWVHNYEPASKCQNMVWKHTTVHFRSVPSAKKMMLTLFWDFNGPILKYYQDSGQTAHIIVLCLKRR